MLPLQKFNYLQNANAEYVEEVFLRYQEDPASVDETWRYFFEGIELGQSAPAATVTPITPSIDLLAEVKVAELIGNYRWFGRLMADVNPLSAPPSSHPWLELSVFGLSESDLARTFQAGKLVGLGAATLKEIIARLRGTYCGKIGIEITQISDRAEREWLQKRLESTGAREALDPETRRFILKRLTDAETFERFLHTRYVAQKRFSIEGGESVIPALDAMIETGAELGAKEFVVGMAHRGRLNVLRNIFGKKAEHHFTEFEGTYKTDLSHGEGDVKYHKGYSTDFTTRKGRQVHLSLASNPSHLEFINPVVEGIVRAKQDQSGDEARAETIPLLLHGDASFAGQGVCYETLNLCQLQGYGTGGTLHIIVNNQIGFTSPPTDSRSTPYSSDLAKMLEAPIFHVNGDDPEAVWMIAKLCLEYRHKFKRDAFIDLVCYRKHGHNEGDEPSFTSPLLYKKIKMLASTREQYAKRLIGEGVLTEAQAQEMIDQLISTFTEKQTIAKAEAPAHQASVFEGRWKGLRAPEERDLFRPIDTAVKKDTLVALSERVNRIPDTIKLHPKLTRFFEARLRAVQEGRGVDWGNGEALAFASLVNEGYPVRLSGQDAERGTFTHRHSVIHCFETGKRFVPLNHLREGQAPFHVYNSHLSETGVMGFEYGYSLAAPRSLVIWEAQFGDFANGAQVIIDQFLASTESKWQRMTGLVLLLPHGFEGQGPEHSSARLERFLQLCGRANMIVANLTTPAQLFHALRRQLRRDFRKPLVIMSPKSLLRHPQAVSTLEELSSGGFLEVIDDADARAKSVRRVLLCTGKVYYDLLSERAARARNDVAIVRIEQLYPWPERRLVEALSLYPSSTEFIWVQEEPRNMGGWSFVFSQWMGGLAEFSKRVGGRAIAYAGREVGAAPAVGSPKLHEQEQKSLLEQAFA